MSNNEPSKSGIEWGALRSYLFVPANRPDRFAKALQSGADAVIIDLEDAVPPAAREEARAALSSFLQEDRDTAPGVARIVRINGLRSVDGLKDLMMLCALERGRPDGLILPKTQCAEDIRLIDDVLTDAGAPIAIGALIETCEGLENAAAIARASEQLVLVMFGGADMALDLRVELQWEPLVHARARVVQAAAGAGVAALDMPWVDLSDDAGYRSEIARSFALGFTARAAIHPSQIAAIHDALMPSEEAVQQAQEVMDTWSRSDGGAATLKGKMIEKPLVAQSQRVLDLARSAKRPR